MEFIDYYRIIRERVWIPVLLAVLCAGVVVAGRAVRPAPATQAVGTLAINPAAFARPQISERGVTLEEPEWNELAGEVVQALRSAEMARLLARQVPGVGGDLGAAGVSLDATPVGDATAVQVVAEAATAQVAVSVVDEATRATLELLGAGRERRFRDTADGIARQLNAANAALAKAQGSVRALQDRHQTADPVKEATQRRTELAQLESQRNSLRMERESLTAREAVLVKALEKQPRYETIQQFATGMPVPLTASDIEAQLNAQIATLQEQLRHRTPRHPAVLQMQQRIEELRRQVEAVRGGAAPSGPTEARIPNPVWATLEGQLWDVRISIAGIDAQLQWIDQETLEISAKVGKLEAATSGYQRLQRDVAAAQEDIDRLRQWQSQLSGQEASVTGLPVGEAQGEAQAVGGRGLRRLVLQLGAALVCGAMLGGILAFFLHYIDVSFKDEASAARVLGQRVLGAIPRSDMPLPEREAPPPEERPNS